MSEVWHWPQYVAAGTLALGLASGIYSAADKGKPTEALVYCFATGLTVWVLWCGGFWG
jgi:hypothetical protein